MVPGRPSPQTWPWAGRIRDRPEPTGRERERRNETCGGGFGEKRRREIGEIGEKPHRNDGNRFGIWGTVMETYFFSSLWAIGWYPICGAMMSLANLLPTKNLPLGGTKSTHEPNGCYMHDYTGAWRFGPELPAPDPQEKVSADTS